MTKSFLNLLIFSALSITGARAADATKLTVGDPAPALKAGKWFKGQPLEKFEAGKVYVVEVWATWCGPCRVSIPHLTELAKKFEGKARIIGMSVSEREPGDATRFQKIEGFIKSMGDKMEYTVAADTSDNFMAQHWMTAAGESGIPSAFVVGRDGRIVWIGHPMNELDTVLAQVVEGSYDSKAAAEKRAKAKERQEARQKAAQQITDLRKEEIQEALAALDKRSPTTRCWGSKMRFSDIPCCSMPATPRPTRTQRSCPKAILRTTPTHWPPWPRPSQTGM
jgi:thiol-disulfide isomerase/thioredoxin